jgi:hypothetical protein
MLDPQLKQKKEDNALIPSGALIGVIEPDPFDRHLFSASVVNSESSGVLHWRIADGERIKDGQIFATISCGPVKIYDYLWQEKTGVIAQRRRISFAKAVLNKCIAIAKYAGHSIYTIVLSLLMFLAPIYVGAFFYFATKITAFGGSGLREIGEGLYYSYIVMLWAASAFLIARMFFVNCMTYIHENRHEILERYDRFFGSEKSFANLDDSSLPFGGRGIPMFLFAYDEHAIGYPGKLALISGVIAAIVFINIYPERLYCQVRGENKIGFEARISEGHMRASLLVPKAKKIPPELNSHEDKDHKVVQILHPNSNTDAYLLAKEGNIQKLIAYDSDAKRYYYQGEYSAIGKKMLFNGKFYDCQ